MSKKTLTTLRSIHRLVSQIEIQAALEGSYLHLCAMYVEFEALCSRYAGPATDLDPFLLRAKKAVGKGTTDWLHAVMGEITTRAAAKAEKPSDAP